MNETAADVLKRVQKRLETMLPEEFKQSVIDCGILNHDGTPSEFYYENQPGVGKKCSCVSCQVKKEEPK